MSQELIETFTKEEQGRGVPLLRGYKNRTTMTVAWGDGTLFDYHEFRSSLNSEAMNAELL